MMIDGVDGWCAVSGSSSSGGSAASARTAERRVPQSGWPFDFVIPRLAAHNVGVRWNTVPESDVLRIAGELGPAPSEEEARKQASSSRTAGRLLSCRSTRSFP